MTLVYPAKFADEVLDYEFDWTARLQEGETITEVTVEANAGVTVSLVATEGAVTSFRLSGGTGASTIEFLAEVSSGQFYGDRAKLPIITRTT